MMRFPRAGQEEEKIYDERSTPEASLLYQTMRTEERRRRPASFVSDRGFTLLELMVAFAILGFIVLIVAGAMRLGIHSLHSGQKRINNLDRFSTSLNVIDSQIESEIPLTYDDNGDTKLYFQGDSDHMQFATNYSIWGGQTGYVVVNYKVENDSNEKQSLAASENVIGVDGERNTTLFTGLDSIYFEYFYKGPTDENGSWVDKWPSDDSSVPAKIKLHLVRGQDDFSLIIPMRTPGSVAQAAANKAAEGAANAPTSNPFTRLLQER